MSFELHDETECSLKDTTEFESNRQKCAQLYPKCRASNSENLADDLNARLLPLIHNFSVLDCEMLKVFGTFDLSLREFEVTLCRHSREF